jgi:non-heme chloroperoxidase
MFAASRGSRRIGDAIATAIAVDMRPRIAALDVPLGVIWGERDRTVPIAALGALRAVVPGAPAETIPDAGHVPQVERPVAFAAALERLLARLAVVTDS